MLYQHKEGISLRKICRSDLKDLRVLKEESWWGTHKTLIINEEDQQRWYDNIPSDQLFMTACLGDDSLVDNAYAKVGDPIGIAIYTDIDWVGRTLNISGSIYPKYRIQKAVKSAFSSGLDFAFEILNMERVQAEVLACNTPAQKLEIDHLQFQIEGTRRKAVYKAGRYYDSIIMGLLREDWERQERIKSLWAEGGSCCQFDHNKAERCVTRFQSKVQKGQ